MNPRADIASFLAQCSISTLPSPEALTLAPEHYNKAGIVPYIRGSNKISFYVMKPQAKHPDLPPPEYQICKGTRMEQKSDGWHDIRTMLPVGPKAEPLVVTALREGIEEIGLIPSNIAQLFDVGSYEFSSAATGKSRSMWLFAAEMKNSTDFIRPDTSTADCRWFTVDEFATCGRSDHYYILTIIDRLLKEQAHSPR